MRSGTIWGVALVLMSAGTLVAQSPPPPGASGQPVALSQYPAELAIVMPEVEVRSGPSAKFYPTSKLRQGDRVLILRESKAQPGWLEIKPPSGSFSWVKAKSIKTVNFQIGVVPEDSQGVAVMPGSAIVSQTPNVEAVKVVAGTQLVILDRPHQAEGETWLPIQPTPTEVRFIPADAVRPPSMPVAIAPSEGGFPTTITGTNNTLILQGDNALRTGNADMARQLYKQAYDTAPNPEDKRFAQNRIASMGSAAPGQTWQPNLPGSAPLVPAQMTSSTSGVPTWSTWGKLRRASFDKGGQPVYLLENKQGQPLVYAVAQPGTSLREYVGRQVCLYGPIRYNSEDNPRVQYMVASHVALP